MGLEPMTSRLEGVRAIQLRQQGKMECFVAGDSLILKFRIRDSNPGQPGESRPL